MKKLWIWLCVLTVLLVSAGFVLTRGCSLSVARCLVANNGSVMMVDGNSPIILSGDAVPETLSTGDKILVFHDGIQETYPGGTRAYAVLKLGSGNLADIPAQVQEELTELGWLGPLKAELPPAAEMTDYETVSYSHGCANMQLRIPQGWDYTIREYDPEQYGFGIDFWPEDAAEGKLSLNFYDLFGVCGTGLEEKTVQIGAYEGWMGAYDNAAVWDFISLQGLPGSYVFQTQQVDTWYEAHEGEITGILESAVLAQNVIWEAEALSIGAEAMEKDPALLRASFDSFSGLWTVAYVYEGGSEQVTIDAKGNVYHGLTEAQITAIAAQALETDPELLEVSYETEQNVWTVSQAYEGGCTIVRMDAEGNVLETLVACK